MRDYKNVRVPGNYRKASGRTTVRRVEVAPGRGKRGSSATGTLGSIVVLILTVALCYGAWEGYTWLTHAEMFLIAGVDVKGVHRVREDEVRAMADLFTGQNIFRVDPAAAVKRARANPWVEDVRIERKLPNRISMDFTERTPRAVLLATNGRFLVDGGGTVITTATAGDPATSSLSAVAIRDWRAVPGEPVTGGVLQDAFTLLDALAERGGWEMGKVTVKADTTETVAIVYAKREFRIGCGNYEEKLRRLGEIVSDMNRQGIEYAAVELRPERQAAVMVVKDRGKGQGAGGKGKKRKG